MGIFGNKELNRGLDLLEKGTTSSEIKKADKTVEMQERLGVTPSSKTRRQVTWFLLSFISFWFSAMMTFRILEHKLMADDLLIYLKEYCSNSVIITIVGFFFGGYYLNKILSPRVKQRLNQNKDEHKLKMKEREINIDQNKKKDDLNLTRKERRINKRNQ